MMKRLLLHHARPLSSKVEKVELQEDSANAGSGMEALGDVEQALSRLAAIDPKFRTVVEMRVFEGLTTDEIALRIGCSSRTVATYWSTAKRWLRKEWTEGSER
jgi:RNA polymerase sigma factor (sigma-70 family)